MEETRKDQRGGVFAKSEVLSGRGTTVLFRKERVKSCRKTGASPSNVSIDERDGVGHRSAQAEASMRERALERPKNQDRARKNRPRYRVE